MTGLAQPDDCPMFGTTCRPSTGPSARAWSAPRAPAASGTSTASAERAQRWSRDAAAVASHAAEARP
ncbi:MAG: hypothetical protein U1F43_11355 [Myxococcota bacterium]